MYLFRMLEIGCIFLSLSGSFAQKVSYDFDKNAKFSQFKTYRWVYIKGAEQLDEQWDRRIRAALDAEFLKKGLSRMDDGKVDLYVGYQTAAAKEENIMSYSLHGAATLGDTTVYIGQLVVDLYDAATENLIWRGAVSKTIDQRAKSEKRPKNLAKAVAKLLKDYPPEAKR